MRCLLQLHAAETTFVETIEEFDELGVVSLNVNRITYSLDGQVSYEIDRAHAVSFSGTFRAVDFDSNNDNFSPNRNVNFATSVSREVNRATKVNLDASVGLFESDDQEESENQTFALTGGFDTKVNSRFSVFGSSGV